MYFCCISISYLCSQITLLFKTIYLTDCKYKALNLAHQFIKNCFINQCHLKSRYDSQGFIFQGYVELVIHPLRQDLKRVKINSKQCRILFVTMSYRFFNPK